MPTNPWPSRITNWLVVLVLVGGSLAVYINGNQILDWYFYYVRSYTLPNQVQALASDATMTGAGRRLFYRADPQIENARTGLVQDCHISGDKTIELGCYLSSDKIYLLSIQDPQLKNEMIVTAAHETLHAAYDRMSDSQKRQIDPELERVAATITDPSFKQRLADYAKSEPGQEDNELHSILGTEQANLPPDLEAHYDQYFSNRSQVVAYSQQFNQTFDGLHNQIVQLDEQIKATKTQMQLYLALGQISRYNSLVPGINNQISTYNDEVRQYNQYARDLLGTEPAPVAQ